MVERVEYRCDTDGCKARLFDLVHEDHIIEIKCPKCKEYIGIDIKSLYIYLDIWEKSQLNKRKKSCVLPHMG